MQQERALAAGLRVESRLIPSRFLGLAGAGEGACSGGQPGPRSTGDRYRVKVTIRLFR